MSDNNAAPIYWTEHSNTYQPQNSSAELISWAKFAEFPDAMRNAEELLANGADVGFFYYTWQDFIDNGETIPAGTTFFYKGRLSGPNNYPVNQQPNIANATTVYVRQITPLNLAWVEDMPPKINTSALQQSRYTHLIVCFFHIDLINDELKMCYNNAGNDPFNHMDLWDEYYAMQFGPNYKTIVAGFGGWGSGTWKSIYNREEEAAKMIVDLIVRCRFAGVDFNFEGPPDVITDPAQLNSLAKLVFFVKKWLPSGQTVSLTPLQDNVILQIQNVINYGFWQYLVDWVNIELYYYNNEVAELLNNFSEIYQQNALSNEISPPVGLGRLIAGFPLETPEGSVVNTAADYNRKMLDTVGGFIKSADARIGGVFIWRYEATQTPSDLNWDQAIEQIFGR